MHIHDTDFANWLLGVPSAVATSCAPFRTGAIDNAVTHYLYENGPVVTGETSWGYGAGFHSALCAIFENATIETGYRSGDVTLARPGAAVEKLELPAKDPYREEIAYFLACIREGREPENCTPFSTRETMRIALAEERSALAGGKRVTLK